MRIDMLLKTLCLVKTRNIGRSGCESGSIKINGRAVKPSRIVSNGDVLEIRYPDRILVIEITGIPPGQVSKREKTEYFRVIRESALDGESGGWNA